MVYYWVDEVPGHPDQKRWSFGHQQQTNRNGGPHAMYAGHPQSKRFDDRRPRRPRRLVLKTQDLAGAHRSVRNQPPPSATPHRAPD